MRWDLNKNRGIMRNKGYNNKMYIRTTRNNKMKSLMLGWPEITGVGLFLVVVVVVEDVEVGRREEAGLPREGKINTLRNPRGRFWQFINTT